MIHRALQTLAACLVATPLFAEPTPQPLKALFLGDHGHHHPAERAAQLIPVLAGRGIHVTYTDKITDLNPETLGKYDALIVYANLEAISPDQERSLVDYVNQGGGFAPIHCASACFNHSDAYIALVGARFASHGVGEFDTKVVAPDHPIMKGLEPFHTWDETYVHDRHKEDGRQVLQTRPDRDHDEPWTWVRTQGRGRVFYTAYGHDARTWGHPGFHDLIERGLRWASGQGDVFDSRPRVPEGLPAFEYEQATGKIPLYLAGKKWGTQGEPIRTMQKPLAPAESVRHLALPAGFEAQLFAAEPDIAKPITLAWDHLGRLWIAETFDYPNELQPPGKGRDRIKICEDTDGDGRADKFTIFAEDLSIPTSLAFANGGVVVHQAPDTLFLKDHDGDDRADERRTLFTGWGTRDTHAGPSNLRWGFDNQLWGIVGYSGFQGTIGGERLEFRQGFYRFRPDGSKLEFLRNTNNNSWGVGFSEDNLVFGSTANNGPSVYLPIPNRYYESVRGGSPRVLENIADSNRFFPITDKVRQVDNHGGFTAAAGHAIYTARTYPKQYWNNTAFVAEPTGHLVATFSLDRQGSDVRSHNAWNLLASDDEWTSPICAEVGPDGNVWVIDWYSFIVQHNPTPEGFRTGKGGAYETPLRDKTHGRIYRIVSRNARGSTLPRLDPADPKGLVSTLKNDNMFWRMHAQRLLVERGKTDVVPDLLTLINNQSVDAIGLNTAAIHSLWTLHGLNALDGDPARATTAAALKHPSASVRRNVLAVLPFDQKSSDALLASGVLNDPDAQVRLAALLALADLPPSKAAAASVAEALANGSIEQDPWLPDAATAAASRNDRAFLQAIAAKPFDRPPGDAALSVVERVAEHLARGGEPDSIAPLIARLKAAQPRVVDSTLAGLAKGWPRDRVANFDDATEQNMIALLPTISPESRGRLLSLASRWGSKGFERATAEVVAASLANARDETKPDAARIAAAGQLVELRKTDAGVVRDLLALINPRTSPPLASGLLAAVGRSGSNQVGKALADVLPALTPAVRPDALRVLLSRADGATALIDAIEAGKVPLSTLALDQRQALAAHPDKQIAARMTKLLASGGGLPDADRQKVIDALSPRVLHGGDAARGKLVFEQQCAKCHTHSGSGGKVGPDLTGMAAHPKEELLVHILDPSRSVEGNFIPYSLATSDGRVLNGLLASETKTSVELIDAEGKTHAVQRDEIEALVASKKSLMPEGFETQVPPESLADLLAFLTQQGKYLSLDLRKVATIVSTRGMFYSKDADTERLIFPDWSPKTFNGVPFQLVDPQGDRVPNVVLLYGPNGQFPPKMPRSVSLPCHASATAIHFLSGVSGWGYPGGRLGSVSLIVRLHYADGQTEDHPLKNGVEFADYIRAVDVPGSSLAFTLRGQQLRSFAVRPDRSEPIERIELIKGPDDTAPLVMAVTVEVRESERD